MEEDNGGGYRTLAFQAGGLWYRHSRLLLSESRRPDIEALLRADKGMAPTPGASAPDGDGSPGILEGYASTIHWAGTEQSESGDTKACLQRNDQF